MNPDDVTFKERQQAQRDHEHRYPMLTDPEDEAQVLDLDDARARRLRRTWRAFDDEDGGGAA